MILPTGTRLVDSGPGLAAAGLAHRVLEPSPELVGSRPTVVLLHGYSGDEDAMWPFAHTLPPGWVVVAARAPHPDPVLGGFAWVPHTAVDWPTLDRFTTAVATLDGCLAALPDLYDADPTRLYLMGFSQGAATAFALALLKPGRVRGVAALVGFVPEQALSGRSARPLAGLPVFMATGQRDRLVPLARARAAARVLRAAGADLDYHEYAVGHKVSADGSRHLKAWWHARLAA